MITSILVLAAAGLLLWPTGSKPEQISLPGLPPLIVPPPSPPASPAASFPSALSSLWKVRAQLKATGHLTEPEREAISLLTLALVAGSSDE